MKRDRCIIGTGDLDRRVEAGTLSSDDADKVRMFAEFCSRSGPRTGKLTPEQRAFHIETMRDAGWREFLGITEAEARESLARAGVPWEPAP